MANINMRRIGRRLKKAREAKHLTQEEFAELLGLSAGCQQDLLAWSNAGKGYQVFQHSWI